MSISKKHRHQNRVKAIRKTLYTALAATLSTTAWVSGQSTDYWIQPTGGAWENDANWSLGVPPSQNYASFNLASGSAYTITNDVQEGAEFGLNVVNNNVTVNDSTAGSLDLGGDLDISASAGQSSGLTFDGFSSYFDAGSGIEVDLGAVIVGDSSPGTTYLTMNNSRLSSYFHGFYFGTGSTVIFNNSYADCESGGFTIGGITTFNNSTIYGQGINIGGSGNAVLNLCNHSENSTTSGAVSSPLTVGVGGNGAMNVDNSYFGTASSIQIGSYTGSGSITLTNGGSIQASEGISIGVQGKGTFNLISGSFLLNSITVGNYGTIVEEGEEPYEGFGGYVVGLLNFSSGAVFDYIITNSISPTIHAGELNFSGSLNVTLADGFEPIAGERFQPFNNFSTETGTFSAVNLPPLNPGLAWNISQLYTEGTLSVVAVPEPAMAGLIVIGIAGSLTRRRDGTRGRFCRRCHS